MIKRFICLALASLCVLALISCGEASGTQTKITAETIESNETTVAETKPEIPVEQCDFGNEKYTILYPNWFLYNRVCF